MVPLLFVHTLWPGGRHLILSPAAPLCFLSLGLFFVITLVLWIYSYFFANRLIALKRCCLILVPGEEVIEESSVRTEKASHCVLEEIVTGCLAAALCLKGTCAGHSL